MSNTPRTSDQKFFKKDGQWKAEIDLSPTDEDGRDPSPARCRHGVLTILTTDIDGNVCTGYVVYDRILSRIVNGVFFADEDGRNLEGVLQVAKRYNTDLSSSQDMAPNGKALGLVYPEPYNRGRG